MNDKAKKGLGDQTHYTYAEFAALWLLLRDVLQGETHIKSKDVEYLPATASMKEDGMSAGQPGRAYYDAYKQRAVWHDVVSEAVDGLLGMMHREPPVIELPTAMEPLLENATRSNESLEELLKRINRHQLEVGRVGLLVDIQDGAEAGTLPYIVLYAAESMRNWNSFDFNKRDELEFVILDESRHVVDDNFEWEKEQRYKLLYIDRDTGKYSVKTEVDGQIEVTEANAANQGVTVPSIAGNDLEMIPFCFANVSDIMADPQKPVLEGVANLALAAYRGEADYRQSLFMQGQDTLVIIGGQISGQTAEDGEENLAAETETRTGAGAVISIENEQGDAKYIGVESKGLEEQRQSIENDLQRASAKGAKLADSNKKEAAESLRVRTASKSYTITNIALAGAAALEKSLKQLATWMGANPDEVKVTPNLEFLPDDGFGGQDIKAMMEAKLLGAPISLRTVHRVMKERDITDFDYEDELEQIDEEDLGAGTNRDGQQSA